MNTKKNYPIYPPGSVRAYGNKGGKLAELKPSKTKLKLPMKMDASKKDQEIIQKIAERAHKMIFRMGPTSRDALDYNMDVTATHLNGCRLRLLDFLGAEDFSFMHDITGIGRHLNRETGKLENFFLPRFAAPDKKELAYLKKKGKG